MKKYIDYDFCKSEYGGNIPESDFDKLVTKASVEISNKILNKDITGHEEIVKFTTCSVADLLYKISQAESRKEQLSSCNEKVVTSEKVEDLSRTYSVTSIKELDEEISNLEKKIGKEIEKNLFLTGLLYKGIK